MTDGDGRYAILPGAVRTGFCIVAIGLLAVAMSISAATVAYPGPLSAYVARGVASMLFGSIVVSLASLWLGSWRGTVSQSQNAIAVVVAIFTASLGASGLADERSFTTAWVFLSATTLATGVAAWVLGRLRLGSLARYMPYPVISGFLAATGYLMVMGGLGTAARERLDLGSLALLVEPGAPVRWVPWAAIAVGIACAMRRFRQPMVLPFGLLAAGAGFNLTLGVLGIDLGEAGRRGLLLGPFGDSFLAAFAGWSPTSVDGWALVAASIEEALSTEEI
ncbi:MAG TPA: SulP family inorganic anion transporter, partial [Amaricoccus sp.]|nr:SulP family inorganic anion transporter [Amaricoccus sp.]